MCCRLALTLLLVAAARTDQRHEAITTETLDGSFPLGVYTDSLVWVGAGQGEGCSAGDSAGELELHCGLPAGRLTVRVDSTLTWLSLQCEDETYSCEDLEQVRAELSRRLHVDSAQTDAHLTLLKIQSCALPASSLSCVAGVVGAREVAAVMIEDGDTPLRREHLAGLTGLRRLTVFRAGPNVTEVPYDALATLPSLQRFTLNGGSVRLSSGSGSGPALPSLHMLELGEANVEAVPSGAFSRSPGVTSLLLWGNEIEDIDANAFDGIPDVVNITLNSNSLRALPGALFARTRRLQHLDLYDNAFLTLPSSLLHGLSELQEVVLFGNRVPLNIEEALFANLPSLTLVQLDNNDITTLPPTTFTNSTNIADINLSYNKLATLPEKLFLNLRLKLLNLSHNVITELEKDLLKGVRTLEKLDLSNNKLQVLPAFFRSLEKLKYLSVANNEISYLDDVTLRGAGELQELVLDSNRLVTLTAATLQFVPGLTTLSVSHNNLTLPLPGGAGGGYSNVELFSPMSSLRKLHTLRLSHNLITDMYDDWRYFVYLRELDLSYNRLSQLDDVAMDFLSAVTVDLRHNNITTVSPRVYDDPADPPTEQLPKFLLDNNPYNCDCRLYPLLHSLHNNVRISTMQLENAQCVQPPGLARRKVLDVSASQLVCPVPCPEPCECRKRPATARLELQCDRLPDAWPVLPRTYLATELRLTRFEKNLTGLPEHVRYVNLSSLNLTEYPSVRQSVQIDLRNNSLTSAPLELLERNCTMYLADNPFGCECQDYDSLQALRSRGGLVLDLARATCHGGAPLAADLARLCSARSSLILGSSLALLGVVLAMFTVIAYMFKVEIRIILRKLGISWDEELGDKEYDAFVSYAHQDEKFVVEQLVPRLESGRRALKLCVHYRDWVVGDWIPAQITRSVDRSRRTIIVLSRHFVNSVWGQMEFRAAHGKKRVIILLLDDVSTDKSLDPELKAYVALNTYVKVDDPLVWERLRDAVVVRTRRHEDKEAPSKLLANMLDAHQRGGKAAV